MAELRPSLAPPTSMQAGTTNLRDTPIPFAPRELFGAWLVMLCCTLLGYAGIVLFQDSLKWDMLDCYLPWRSFVADSVGHRIFPLWDPYQHGGYPIHGDMRSSFAPEAWIIGLFGGYKVSTLHVLFTLYISLGGTGVALLAGHFTPVHRARLMAGMAYVLCGFFVGHGQEMFGIVAAAWIPWILHYFMRLQRTASWGDVWKVALFLVLCLLGGYQALSIILAYLLATLFIVELVADLRARDMAMVRRKVLQHAVLVLVVAAAMAVLVVTYVQVGPLIARFGGMTLEQASTNPLPPKALVSLVLPFTVVAEPAYFATDLSMSNVHVGLLTLLCAALALRRRWSASERVFIVFGACCLLVSFGKHAPFHGFVFHYVPLMDLFRMPSFFSYFTQLALLLVGAGTLGRVLQVGSPERRLLPLVAGIAAVGVLVFAWWVVGADRIPLTGPFTAAFRMRGAEGFGWQDHLGAQAALQALILVLFTAGLLLLRHSDRGLRWLLPGFLLVEMGAATWLNFPYTVGGPPEPSRVQRILDTTPRSFMIPDLRVPVGANADGPAWMSPLWRNTHNYTRTVSLEGFNSFQLDATARFTDNMPVVNAAVRDGPVLYFGNGCKPLSAFTPVDAVVVMVAVPDGAEARCPSGGPSPGDTIIVTRFDPGDVHARIRRAQEGLLVLVQTDHPGWEVLLDGRPVDHFTAMGAFIGCTVSAGTHEVRYVYRNPAVVYAAIFSGWMLVLVVGLALQRTLRDDLGLAPGRARNIAIAGIASLVTVLVIAWRSGERSDEERLRTYGWMAAEAASALHHGGTPVLFDVDRPDLMDSLLRNLGTEQRPSYIRNAGGANAPSTRALLDRVNGPDVASIVLAGHGAPLDPEVEELVLRTHPKAARSGDRHTWYNVYERGGDRPSLFDAVCDFERVDERWPFDPARVDTAVRHDGVASWRIDAHQPGGPELRIEVKNGLERGARLVVEVWAYTEQEKPGDALYVEVFRDDARIWSTGKSIREQATGTGRWFPVLMAVEPPFDLRTGDLIKVFVWGGDHGPIHLDDMRARLFAKEGLQIERSRIR